MDLRSVAVPGGELEVAEWGAGEPIVFIQTALTADELLPLASHPVLEDGFHKILYHRRGYAASSPVEGPGSIPRDAADCRDLLAAMGVGRAHIGPGWRDEVEGLVPGAARQMERDTVTFFDTDLPALLDWEYDGLDARRISCPVLHIGGGDSGPWFAEVRALILTWLPNADDVVIDGAEHSLVLTHTPQAAEALATFVRRHPLE